MTVFQPNEVGKVEFVFDTRRFRGRKTKALYLKMDNGQTIETKFTVTADSQDEPMLSIPAFLPFLRLQFRGP